MYYKHPICHKEIKINTRLILDLIAKYLLIESLANI